MAKIRTSYFCQNCGAESAKWIGKCPACGEWNTYVEEVVQREETTPTSVWKIGNTTQQVANKPRAIDEINYSEEARIVTADQELNRVLGGGIVPGSMVLIGGEPGIGKSTLMLQIALSLNRHKVLYISGEESEQQIKMRAERLSMQHPGCYILTETGTQNIFKQIELLRPDVLIV